jgi:hypothetical protein
VGRTPLCHDLKGSVHAPTIEAMSDVVSIHAKRLAKRERGDDALETVQRGGRTFHAYGSGEDGNVFELPQRKAPDSPWDATPAA